MGRDSAVWHVCRNGGGRHWTSPQHLAPRNRAAGRNQRGSRCECLSCQKVCLRGEAGASAKHAPRWRTWSFFVECVSCRVRVPEGDKQRYGDAHHGEYSSNKQTLFVRAKIMQKSLGRGLSHGYQLSHLCFECAYTPVSFPTTTTKHLFEGPDPFPVPVPTDFVLCCFISSPDTTSPVLGSQSCREQLFELQYAYVKSAVYIYM